MKLKKLFIGMAAIMIALTGCAQKQSETAGDKPAEETKGKVLVAYFSATGTTKKVAEEVAEVMGGTLFEIEPAQPYTAADLDWHDKQSRSTIEMQDKNSRPEIKNKVKDIDQYTTVFIGYPVWWYVAPTIINTFIEENNLKGKVIIPFATSGGSPIEPCDEALKNTYPDLDWKAGKLLNECDSTILEGWKKELGL